MRTRPTQGTISAVFALGLLALSLGAAHADELPAGDSLQSLFGGDSQPAPEAPAQPPSQQSLTKANLGVFLKAAGYEAKNLGGNSFKITVTSGTWTAPMVIGLSPDDTVLWYRLNLATLNDQTRVPADKMLALMAAGRDMGVSFFVYEPKSKKLQIVVALPNKKMSAARFNRFANSMVQLAIKTEALWNPAKWGQSGGGVAAKHIGSWVATTQQVRYRLTLNANGTFSLVARTASIGRYTITGNRLSLQGTSAEGTIQGTLLWTGPDTFVLQIDGAHGNALTFKRG